MSSPIGKRRTPLPLDPGTSAELRHADVLELLEARRELDAARAHVGRVTDRLRRQLGAAEFGTVNGVIVLRREQSVTGGGYVRQNHRDDLKTVVRQ